MEYSRYLEIYRGKLLNRAVSHGCHRIRPPSTFNRISFFPILYIIVSPALVYPSGYVLPYVVVVVGTLTITLGTEENAETLSVPRV